MLYLLSEMTISFSMPYGISYINILLGNKFAFNFIIMLYLLYFRLLYINLCDIIISENETKELLSMENTKVINEIKRRFKILEKTYGLMPTVAKEFIEKQTLYKSEFGGILYWLDDDEKQMIEKIEKEKGIKVYHVILSHMEFGDIYSLFYISKDEEEWELDREDLSYGTPFVYAHNATDNYCSEFGSIGICGRFGGLCRTA